MRVVLPTLLLLSVGLTDGLECYSCQNVTDPSTCHSKHACAAGQSCYQHSRSSPSGLVYDMGCRDVQVCAAQLPGYLVGRSVEKRQQTVCHQCCSENLCNAQLCLNIGANATSTQTDDALLIMDTSGREILYMDLHTHNIKVIPLTPSSSPQAFDYDPIFREIYWADTGKTISKTSLDSGSTTELIRMEYDSFIRAIAVDPLARLMFIVGENAISVVSLTTMKMSRIIVTSIGVPYDIELDLKQRKLYWSEVSNGTIEVADYDGSSRRTILSTLHTVMGIALDTNKNAIYWGDSSYHTIERANLDGSNRENITLITASIYVSLEVDGSMLYYTDSHASSVMAVPISGGQPHQIGKNGFGELEIKINRKGFNITASNNGCSNNNGGCDHICVPTGSGNSKTCFCTDGYNLSSNGLTCVGYPLKVRLSGSSNTNEGRVEVSIDNGATWGTVCGTNFNSNEASVVCKTLGMSSANSIAKLYSFFGAGLSSQQQLIYGINCGGHESALAECGHANFGTLSCGHDNDAGVICARDGPVRLVASSARDQGRVEIFMNGEWGTICDDNFGYVEAGVVCGMLGYARNGAVPTNNFNSGSASQPIHLDNVVCDGNEETLLECRHNAVDTTDCLHKEDIGVVCQAAIHAILRLEGTGSTELQGRVEMSTDHGATWSTICSDYFDSTEAEIICRMLGFSAYNATYWGNAYFGEGHSNMSSKAFSCNGLETSILNCNNYYWWCPHSKDVGVRCRKVEQVRLVNGSTAYQGRIELSTDNGMTWGTICDDNFDDRDAEVVCSMLGYGTSYQRGATAKGSAFFGAGQSTQSILLDDLACNGYERTILECQSNGLGVHNCRHRQDAGVICVP